MQLYEHSTPYTSAINTTKSECNTPSTCLQPMPQGQVAIAGPPSLGLAMMVDASSVSHVAVQCTKGLHGESIPPDTEGAHDNQEGL